jgi:hypothetical protein
LFAEAAGNDCAGYGAAVRLRRHHDRYAHRRLTD